MVILLHNCVQIDEQQTFAGKSPWEWAAFRELSEPREVNLLNEQVKCIICPIYIVPSRNPEGDKLIHVKDSHISKMDNLEKNKATEKQLTTMHQQQWRLNFDHGLRWSASLFTDHSVYIPKCQ